MRSKNSLFRSKLSLALAVAALLGAVAAVVRLRRASPVGGDARPAVVWTALDSPDAPPDGNASPAAISPRRDADYWPQQAYPIAFKSRTIQPLLEFPAELAATGTETGSTGALAGAIGAQDGAATRITIWIVQFGGPLTQGNITALREIGIDVLLPTSGCAFHVRASYRALCGAAGTANAGAPRILGWAWLRPDDKLFPALWRTPPDCDAGRRLAPHAANAYRLELYPRVDHQALKTRLSAVNATILAGGSGWLEVSVPAGTEVAPASLPAGTKAGATTPKSALKLAALDEVYAVDFQRPRKRALNEEAAQRSNITPLQGAPRNLSGAGITVLVRDEGQAFSHPDFGARLILGSDVLAGPPVVHATHVAGTIGGSGLADPLALARGMAPGCQIVVFDLNGSDTQEPLDGKAAFGAFISNHSYGFVTGWDNGVFNNNQDTFGLYSSFARDWDAIVRSDGLIIVKAVGNDRADSGPGFPHDGTPAADGEFYDCVDASSTGKNILSVGAALDSAQAGVPSSSAAVLATSSSGPADDGRLRPELIANGDNVNSCNTSAAPGQEYTRLSGTSMSCAAASGAAALMTERFRQAFGSTAVPPPHFIRALFAHTATDLGRPGPDYLHGYGLLDLSAAVSLFDADGGTASLIVSNTLTAAVPERFFALNSDGVSAIKATLCWTDDPGDLLAVNAIVNDLDLRLVRASDQTVTFPFKLDPARPEQNAANAPNKVDTIEQVILNAPSPGQYLLAVRGATLASSTNFTLCGSHVLAEVLAPIAVISSSSTSGQPPFPVTFDGSGSSDPDGAIAQFLWDFGDGSQAQGPLVQHTYGPGNFQARLTVVDTQGASASSSVIVAVNNTPPVAAAAVTPQSGPAPLACMFTSAGSSDLEAPLTAFNWDFGDGTSAQGAVVSHTYTASGLYFATLTVTDNGGASDSQQVIVLVGQPLTATSSRFTLNFSKPGVDRFQISATLPIAPDFTTSAVTGNVRVGDVEYSFTLDDRGRFKIPPLSITLTPSRGKLKVALSKTSLGPALSASGATSRDVDGQLIRIPVALSLDDGSVFGATGLPYSYSAKQGKTGRAKLILPK